MKQQFIDYLQNHDLEGIRSISKSDLHNHAGAGGNVKYIEAQENVKISRSPVPFKSMVDAHIWFTDNIKIHTTYLKRVEAAFVQAAEDNIHVLAMSFGLSDTGTFVVSGKSSEEMDIGAFIQVLNLFHQRQAPSTIFLPELSFDRACNIEIAYSCLEKILPFKWVKSVDISCDEFSQPIRNFKKIYKKAKEAGLRLKAHVGELGTADNVMEAVEELELDEVHHGIAAARSPQIMKWLALHKIQLNVCPSSNVMLGIVDNYALHPIRKLYDYGVPVTINTDDLLIFNQTVSQEYMNLYEAGLMNDEELNHIRETGLNELSYYESKD